MNRDDKIDQLTKLATRMREKEKTIENLEKKLEQEKYEYNTVSAHEIPILMSELGMRSFTLDDGTFFSVVPVLKVSAPKEKINEIEDWLNKNGHGGLVKTNIDVSLPRASSKLPEIKHVLDNMGIEYEVTKGINYQTLNKWGREMEEEGMVIPENLFGVYRSHKTIID